MRNRARAGGDAGFSAVRGPREIADFVGWACARPPGPMKMQGTSGARHCYVFFTTTLVDFQSRDHQVKDAVRHLALGHLLALVARAIGEDDHAGVLVAAEADVLARDVIGDDCLQTLALHLLQPFAGEVGVLGGESDTEDARRVLLASERGNEVLYRLELQGQGGRVLATDLSRSRFCRAKISYRRCHHQEVRAFDLSAQLLQHLVGGDYLPDPHSMVRGMVRSCHAVSYTHLRAHE